MINFFQNTKFILGFFFGIIIIILLNIFFPAENNCASGNLCDFQGFPFIFYQSGFEERDGGSYIGEILWFGLIADILLTILFGFVIGLILKFVWSETTARKLD